MRVPASRRLVERLAQLQRAREVADAEARGLVSGWIWALGQDPGAFIAYDDGTDPALILSDRTLEEDPSVTDETTTPPAPEPEPAPQPEPAPEPAPEPEDDGSEGA